MDTHGHATTLGHRAPHSLPLAATLGALGIVYGDIGTSPLYAFKEAAKAASGHAALEPGAVLGVLSLMLWALILVVSLKYAILILRADNRGEGGIMAMLALLHSRDAPPSGWRALILVLGLIGAALLYGDGAITPAISVLSAVEGLNRASFFGETQMVDFARVSRRSRVRYWVRSGLIPSRAKALVWSGVGRA